MVMAAVPAATAARATAAPGGPGTASYFDLARKDCVGTATGTGSKVWYTVADGVLSDVYEPTIDNTNVGTLQYVVTDGRTFTDLQTRDLTYTVAADPTGMACTVTATSKAAPLPAGHHVPDRPGPGHGADAHPTARQHTWPARLRAAGRARERQRRRRHRQRRRGHRRASRRCAVPVVYDTSTVSQATNRDYAVPTYMALRSTSTNGAPRSATRAPPATASRPLDATHSPRHDVHERAERAHRRGVGRDTDAAATTSRWRWASAAPRQAAVGTAGASLDHPFDRTPARTTSTAGTPTTRRCAAARRRHARRVLPVARTC